MAKTRGVNQKSKYAALNKRLQKYVALVQSVYDTCSGEAARIALRTDYSGEEPFSFRDYPETKGELKKLMQSFTDDIKGVIYSGTSAEWKESNMVQDLLANKVLKSYDAIIDGKKQVVYYQQNNDALKAFQSRKDKGLGLSQKVWNQSKELKLELESAISVAIEKGTSAVTLSKRISKYLSDFPSLKKDYKEKYGVATNCHDCEYRSIRLARSEINMAYRTAEQTRWKQFDFVLGYEIKLSGSHPKTDICDMLAGKYPKDFVWTGWHPNDLCYCIPILKTEEEFWNDDEHVDGIIDEVPVNFKQWVVNNKERIELARERDSLPYFLNDNLKYVKTNEKVGFVMNDEVQKELTRRRFGKKNRMSNEEYNNSPISGFNILEFDDDMSIILDEYKLDCVRRLKNIGYEEDVIELIYQGKDDNDFMLSRHFRFDEVDGKRVKIVSHTKFELPDELQGKGFSKKVMSALFRQYEKAGIDEVHLHANMSVGGLCWAKYGFLAEKSSIQAVVEDRLVKGLISKEEYSIINMYIGKYDDYVPMQDLAYANFGERLLKGSSWHGKFILKDKAQLEYLHRYLGI